MGRGVSVFLRGNEARTGRCVVEAVMSRNPKSKPGASSGAKRKLVQNVRSVKAQPKEVVGQDEVG